MAIAARIRITVTTIKSSINEKPVSRRVSRRSPKNSFVSRIVDTCHRYPIPLHILGFNRIGRGHSAMLSPLPTHNRTVLVITGEPEQPELPHMLQRPSP